MARTTSIFLFVLFALCLVSRAQGPGVTNDLWDVSQGTVVTLTTGIIAQSNASNMFGRVSSGAPDISVNTHFRDDKLAGYTHAIEWQVPAPVTLTRYVLYTYHDDDTASYDRAISSVKLYAFNALTSQFDLIDQFLPTIPYFMGVFDRTVAPVVAQRFRAEFVQHACCHFPGPRVQELDGFGPERTSAGLAIYVR